MVAAAMPPGHCRCLFGFGKNRYYLLQLGGVSTTVSGEAMSAMNFTHCRTLSMFVAGALVTLALQGAAAQTPPPPPNPPEPAQAAPPENTAPPAPAPPPAPAGAPAATPNAEHAVTHSNVNLRNGPGTTFTVVTLIPAGSSVEVSGCEKDWCQVVFDGQNGYIIESSIAPGSPGPASPPGPPRGYAGPPGPPPPGYAPPPGYYPPPPGYYPPPYYYGYGPYYGPYGGWRRGYWRRW
jgi:Bacterial SH3 domain